MDGKGGDRLLGKTTLSPLEVLVREMAQNSWDARLDGSAPEFGIHLRRLDFRLRAEVETLLSDALSDGHQVLARTTNQHILEVFDRGTTGLDGPVDLRNSAPGVSKNYEDLILKVGVPRDDGKGGGTYGFGKTAAYAFSEIGVVIYWTRCVGPSGALEHRFVVSAFQDSYSHGAAQYTGRHWWGVVPNEDAILPVVGDEAQRIGERLFQRGFGAGETGTSILILDPRIPNEDVTFDVNDPDRSIRRDGGSISRLEELFERSARTAIRQHLWPKLVPLPDSNEVPMRLSLAVAERTIDLVSSPPGAISSWRVGLNAIRALRAGDDAPMTTPEGVAAEVHAISRNQQVIGHLAFVRRITALEATPTSDDLDPLREGSSNATVSRIALMRGQAELIVSTEDWVPQTSLTGIDWVAVFKASDEFDHLYAEAEPPTHDAWVEGTGNEPSRIARHTRLRVARLISDILAPQSPQDNESARPVRVGDLSRRLSTLLPPQPQQQSGLQAGERARARKASAADSVEVHGVELLETLPDGRQRQRVVFTPRGTHDRVGVDLKVSIVGEDGAREPIAGTALDATWYQGEDAVDNSSLHVGVRSWVEFLGAPRRAMKIDLVSKGVDVDGSD